MGDTNATIVNFPEIRTSVVIAAIKSMKFKRFVGPKIPPYFNNGSPKILANLLKIIFKFQIYGK